MSKDTWFIVGNIYLAVALVTGPTLGGFACLAFGIVASILYRYGTTGAHHEG